MHETAAPKPAYPTSAESLPTAVIREGRYEARFARTDEELDEVLKLRFEVFNLELGEGLESSFVTGRDRDEFDDVCHHLMVLEHSSGRVVGTYRTQTSTMAEDALGFYSAGLFDVAQLPSEVIEQSIELGRACIAPEHRKTQVLHLLWRGLALYMIHNQRRYSIGCSSLTSQDPLEGLAVLRYLEQLGCLHPQLRVAPQPGFECVPPHPEAVWDGPVEIPRLFRIYLRHGCRICGPPAIDRDFKTIDFLMILDLAGINERERRAYFDSLEG